MFEGIMLTAGAVGVLAIVRIVALVPGFGERAVRPMSHAIVVLGLAFLVMGGAVFFGAPLAIGFRLLFGAMLTAWGATLVLVGRAADHRDSPQRVPSALGLRRR